MSHVFADRQRQIDPARKARYIATLPDTTNGSGMVDIIKERLARTDIGFDYACTHYARLLGGLADDDSDELGNQMPVTP